MAKVNRIDRLIAELARSWQTVYEQRPGHDADSRFFKAVHIILRGERIMERGRIAKRTAAQLKTIIDNELPLQ